MKALITGGAGFVGSHLAEALLARGDTVHVLDNLSTGAMDNIGHLKGRERFHYLIDTVMNERVVAEMIDHVDVVYHLAAAVGVKLIVESPVNTIETNVHGTEMVLKVASKKKKKVLIASTSEVYGKSEEVPFREDADLVLGATTKGRWSYACSKAIDEFLALAYWKEKHLPVVVFRLFNTVGPRQTGRYGMVIPNFVKQALQGAPITVFGDGTPEPLLHLRDRRGGRAGQAGRAPGRGGRGAEHRQRPRGDLDPRAGRARQGAHGVEEPDRDDPLRRGVRGRVRGHAPPRPRPDQDPHPARLRAPGAPRRDPRQGRRVLHGRTGRGFDRGPPPLLRHLGKLASHSAVYGAADVFTTVVNLLLIPLYTTYLGATEYGHLALLLLFSTAAKIVFRLGLDAGFFRVHYDMTTDADRRRLAGTVALFAVAVASVLMAAVGRAARAHHPRAARRRACRRDGSCWPRATCSWGRSPSSP